MEARYEFAALPFESVVDQTTFRDKNGLLYLLRHMHLAQSDPALQVRYFDLPSLVPVLCHAQEDYRIT